MCARTTCRACGKPTWTGCGAHVEAVLGDVPKAERCACTAEQKAAAKPSLSKMLGSLFGMS
ncbi:MAG: hypothetical protein GY913_32495 [Proteobacteria bacterium]|nr:hypothetical protein [Pseudomonadota bacterium]MCP4921642.1 hypothetical protein [Pseudomonadota bacterium]